MGKIVKVKGKKNFGEMFEKIKEFLAFSKYSFLNISKFYFKFNASLLLVYILSQTAYNALFPSTVGHFIHNLNLQ